MRDFLLGSRLQSQFASAFAGLDLRRDQKRYTGIPSKTSTRPGHVYWGLYRNNTIQIHAAITM